MSDMYLQDKVYVWSGRRGKENLISLSVYTLSCHFLIFVCGSRGKFAFPAFLSQAQTHIPFSPFRTR